MAVAVGVSVLVVVVVWIGGLVAQLWMWMADIVFVGGSRVVGGEGAMVLMVKDGEG